MNIKAILKTVKNDGLLGAYRIHRKRARAGVAGTEKTTAEAEQILYDELLEKLCNEAERQVRIGGVEDCSKLSSLINSAKLMQIIFESEAFGDTSKIDGIEGIIAEINNCKSEDLTDDRFADWDARLRALETGKYKTLIKRLFVSNIYPLLYNSLRDKSIDDKIVFMQPRDGLNQSFKYIYGKINDDYPYEPILCELHHGRVSTIEHYMNGLDFIKEMATAKAVMLHESGAYISHIDVRPETKIIQLWHGCGVIKHLGLTNADKPGFKKASSFAEFPEHSKYDLVTIASDELRWIFEEFMGREPGDPIIQAVGVSRTDEFFDKDYVKNCYNKLHDLIPDSQNKKVILYAPTYRGKGVNRFAPNDLDVAKMAERLSDEYILIIKHHQTAKGLPDISDAYKDDFAWDMSKSPDMDINQLMTVADVLISDYSSVVFEFSLFERPIIFYMFDIDEYSDSRGLYYTYEELAECGPICHSNDELIECISHLDDSFDKSKVTEFKNRFMSACDGHATERIMDFVNQS